MADSGDIETALVALVAAAFYPSGVGSPSTIGSPLMVERGWPTADLFGAAVKENGTLIFVHADKMMDRDATRYLPVWQGTAGIPTITATASGVTVTIAGTPSAGQSVAVQVKYLWYVYTATGTDTLATIASALAALIPGASAAGAVLTLPAAGPPVQARVSAPGTSSIEVARQRQAFRLVCWSPTTALRDQVFGQLPGIIGYSGSRLTMPDGSIATRMSQRQSGPDDTTARFGMWRRDMMVIYDWPILFTQASGTSLTISDNFKINSTLPAVFAGDVLNPAQASSL